METASNQTADYASAPTAGRRASPLHLRSERLARSTSPFSHIVIADGCAYVSGILGQMPETGSLVGPGISEQAAQAFFNVRSLLNEVNITVTDVVRTTIYLLDFADFEEMNVAYRAVFTEPYPARVTLAVAGLPLGARMQIDAIARNTSD